MEFKHFSDNEPHKESLNFTNLIWFLRNKSIQNQKFSHFCNDISFISKSLNNISYENRDILFQKILKIKKRVNDIISDSIIESEPSPLFKRKIYFNELSALLDILLKNKKKELEHFLKGTKYLFKDYSGLGMNYFVGFKK